MTKLSKDDTTKWLQNNQSHLEQSLKAKYNCSIYRDKSSKSEVVDETFGPIAFFGKSYRNARELKNEIKLILAKTKSGSQLEGKDLELVKELLKFHHKGKEKLEQCKGIAVNNNEQYENTRCFYIVKEDGSREDFSFHKCINQLVLSKQSERADQKEVQA